MSDLRRALRKSSRFLSARLSATAFIVTLSVSIPFAGAQAQHENHAGTPAASSNAFNSIKTLVGDWEGTFQWIGTARKGQMNARYYLTGNGSAVVEDLTSDGKTPNMTTVYHLNGTELRATHYCGAG
jgi:hypothetical protein